jgi:hypothetical protein
MAVCVAGARALDLVLDRVRGGQQSILGW